MNTTSIIPAPPGWWAGIINHRAEMPAYERTEDGTSAKQTRDVIDALLIREPIIGWVPVRVQMPSGGGMREFLLPALAGSPLPERMPPSATLILPPRGIKADAGDPLLAVLIQPGGTRSLFATDEALAVWCMERLREVKQRGAGL